MRDVDTRRQLDARRRSCTSGSGASARDYPGRPYWVHFQTTDVHEPNHPPSPFAGLFVAAEDRRAARRVGRAALPEGRRPVRHDEHRRLLRRRAEAGRRSTGTRYFNVRRGLYDETMAHQDRELERFVERLKAAGRVGEHAARDRRRPRPSGRDVRALRPRPDRAAAGGLAGRALRFLQHARAADLRVAGAASRAAGASSSPCR